MNNPASTSRSADLAALTKATGADGNVDLTAFEAQRLMYRHASIDGVDANALVRDLAGSSAYAQPDGKAQMQPLLDAISGRLPPQEAQRFAEALDKANITDTLLERPLEVFSENMGKTWRSVKAGVGQVDASISDALADGRRWAEQVRDNPDNSYLERAAANLASNRAEHAQDLYGQAKGASTHGVAMLGEVVDLAKFGARFSTDTDFRNLIIGAGLVYASETIRDPSKPVDDVRNVAVGAWNEWRQGLEQAQEQGKEKEYLGEAKGAVGIELLAAIVPATKLVKLGKIANAVDAVDDAVPDVAGQTGRRVAGEATELLDALVDSARKAQKGAEWESDSADLMFKGLAGVKRSHGELRELIEDMRTKGQIDGLLGSGSLALRELNYLARQDVAVFDGSVSFNKAIEKWVGDRKLSELTGPMVGDIGEAMVAHQLARQGYRDLVPIQNNSGHGNDLAGINPETGRWEVVEVKASVQGIARKQGGDPEAIIEGRLEKAAQALKLWAPKNMWEEQAAATARRLLEETYDRNTGKLDIDAKWARVNIERDADGRISAEPHIETWKTPEERKLDRQQKGDNPDQAAPRRAEASVEETAGVKSTTLGVGLAASTKAPLQPDFAPSLQQGRDLRDPQHEGDHAYCELQHKVAVFEARQHIPHGPHSNQLAASTLQFAVENNIHYSKLLFEKNQDTGQTQLRHWEYGHKDRHFDVDLGKMALQPIETSSQRVNAALSPHYGSTAPALERTHEQRQWMNALPLNDGVLFARVRGGTPGHTSDEHVMATTLELKKIGMDAASIGQVSMVGDHIRVAGAGEWGKTVMLDVSKPAPPLQDSVNAVTTFNQQQAQTLAQQQNQPTQDDPDRGPKGPRLA